MNKLICFLLLTIVNSEKYCSIKYFEKNIIAGTCNKERCMKNSRMSAFSEYCYFHIGYEKINCIFEKNLRRFQLGICKTINETNICIGKTLTGKNIKECN